MTTAAPIEIFRPGRFTSVEGTVVDLTVADLEATAAAYDPVGEPAPLVKGHPQLDHPAYGWVGKLEVVDGKLQAIPSDVEPAFGEEVRAKRYRRVSPSFYPPAHPNNPSPGVWALKHVGFLGAAAPAVRGLAPVHFSEAQLAGAITIDLSPEEEPAVADKTEDQTADFAEREAALTVASAALDARAAELDRREAEAATAAATARHGANVSFAEGLITGGKLKPFGKDKLVGLLDVLDASAVVSFGETAGELAPIDVFKEMLTAAEPFISFAEAAPPEPETLVDAVSFAAPAGYSADSVALAIHVRAIALQVAEPGLTYLDAVKRAGG